MAQQITSVMAQPSLFEKQTQRAQILATLASAIAGLTDEQIQDALKMDGSTERPRRGELLKGGLIKDSGVKRMTKRRKWAIVWVATNG